MSDAAEHVAIVVVTYNSAEVLPGLLASLPQALAGLAWNVVIVDNDSADDSVGVARRADPSAIIVQTGRNAGYAAGINAGVRAAPAEHTCVLALNPDVRLEPGCVAALLAVLRMPGTGIAVPELLDAHGVRIDNMRRETTVLRCLADAAFGARRAERFGELSEIVSKDSAYRSDSLTDWAEGSTLLISRECWERSGAWDESFFLYSEETEFALRAGDNGFSVRYTPAARAVHLEGGGSRESPGLWTLLVVNRVRLFRRRNGIVRSCAYWAVMLSRELSRAMLGRSTSRTAARALLSRRSFTGALGPDTVAAWSGSAD